MLLLYKIKEHNNTVLPLTKFSLLFQLFYIQMHFPCNGKMTLESWVCISILLSHMTLFLLTFSLILEMWLTLLSPMLILWSK